VAVSPGDQRLYVTWTATWNPNTWKVTASPTSSPGGPSTSVTASGSARGAEVAGLSNGTPYSVSVTAVGVNGVMSAATTAPSAVAPAPLAPAPSGPRGFRGNVYDEQGRRFSGAVSMVVNGNVDPAASGMQDQPGVTSAQVFRDGSFTVEVPQQLDPAVQAAVDNAGGVLDFMLLAGNANAGGIYPGSIRLAGSGIGDQVLGLVGGYFPHLNLDTPTDTSAPAARPAAAPQAIDPGPGQLQCRSQKGIVDTIPDVPVTVGEVHSWDFWTAGLTYSKSVETTVAVAVQGTSGAFTAMGSKTVGKTTGAGLTQALDSRRAGYQVRGHFLFNRVGSQFYCLGFTYHKKYSLEAASWNGDLFFGKDISQFDGPNGFATYGDPRYIQNLAPGQTAMLDQSRSIAYGDGATIGYTNMGVGASVTVSSSRSYSGSTTQSAGRPATRTTGNWRLRGNNGRYADPGTNIMYVSTS